MTLAVLLLSAATASASPVGATLGRDVVVSRPVSGRIVAVLGNVRIASRVSGDVVVWGGDITFSGAGSVEGNVSVFGGEVHGPAGKPLPVTGLVTTPGALLSLYLAEMRRAPWQAEERAAAFRSMRLVALSAWLAISLTLLLLFGSPFARAAASAEGDWSGSLLAGALGVLTLFLSAAAAFALLPAPLSVPIAALLGAVAVCAKIFGMGALFLLLGQKILRNVSAPRRPFALAVGFTALGGASLLPVLGALLWSAASVVAVGIAFLSRFGTPRYRVALPAA